MHIYEIPEGNNNAIGEASASDAVIISSITNLVGTDACAIDMPTSETSIERISRLPKEIVNRQRVKRREVHVIFANPLPQQQKFGTPVLPRTRGQASLLTCPCARDAIRFTTEPSKKAFFLFLQTFNG